MKIFSQWRLARCSRAQLLFVSLLVAVYLGTLIFFHVELDDTSARRVVDTADVVEPEKRLVEMGLRLLADRRPRVWNGSTQNPTASGRLERCGDVAEIRRSSSSARKDRLLGSWPHVFNRHPINLAAPTLPWCADTPPPTQATPANESSSFRQVAGNHFVYSAYFDDREPTAPWGVVRVIALLRTGSATPPTPSLFCHVDMTSNDWSISSMMRMMLLASRFYTAPLQYYEMCENHGKDYGGWILTCPLPRGLRRPPCHLFISSSESVDPTAAVSLPVFTTRPSAGADLPPIRFPHSTSLSYRPIGLVRFLAGFRAAHGNRWTMIMQSSESSAIT